MYFFQVTCQVIETGDDLTEANYLQQITETAISVTLNQPGKSSCLLAATLVAVECGRLTH